MAKYKTENGNVRYNVSDKRLSELSRSDVEKNYPGLTDSSKKKMLSKCKQESSKKGA